MREVESTLIIEEVARMCMETNYSLPNDIFKSLIDAIKLENFNNAKEVLNILKNNADLAKNNDLPICQDTGMTCIYVEIGQEVHVSGNLNEAINEGVRKGYQEGYLRKSVVADPILHRVNTDDNTPAIIHYEIVSGDKLKITVAPKGFGSENMCRIAMMKPSDGIEGIKSFILDTVEKAGPNPCPPMVIGVGIGGTFDSVGYLAKKAMLKRTDEYHPDKEYALIEKEMLEKINALGIGPAGFGGRTTALSLHIETYPTHIAGMPVAVAICCHAARHQEVIL